MKYDVFISYSRKDISEVLTIKQKIEQKVKGIRIWFDINGIESGDEFEDKIIKAINNSSFVLFALSPNSIGSQWTKDEVMYAKNTGKKIVPMLLRGAKLEGWFLFKFGRIDCIDTTDRLQMDKLTRDLSNWCGLNKSVAGDSQKEKSDNSISVASVFENIKSGKQSKTPKSQPKKDEYREANTNINGDNHDISEDSIKSDKNNNNKSTLFIHSNRKILYGIIATIVIFIAIIMIRHFSSHDAIQLPQTDSPYTIIFDSVQQNQVSEDKKTKAKGNGIPNDFVLVPAGTLSNKEYNGENYEYKSYEIDSFYICKYELTQGEYERVMGNLDESNYSFEYGDYLDKKRSVKGSDIPVLGTYLEFAEYCNKKSKSEGYDGFYDINGSNVVYRQNGNGYRLLHYLEWTFAAKGGATNDKYRYIGSNTIKEVAWYGGNSNDKPHSVGKKKANTLGLYDMAGNVSEFLQSTSKNGKYRVDAGSSYHEWTGYSDEMFSPYDLTYYEIKNRRNGTRIAFIPKGMVNNNGRNSKIDY